jgi:hypothetical protein
VQLQSKIDISGSRPAEMYGALEDHGLSVVLQARVVAATPCNPTLMGRQDAMANP